MKLYKEKNEYCQNVEEEARFPRNILDFCHIRQTWYSIFTWQFKSTGLY